MAPILVTRCSSCGKRTLKGRAQCFRCLTDPAIDLTVAIPAIVRRLRDCTDRAYQLLAPAGRRAWWTRDLERVASDLAMIDQDLETLTRALVELEVQQYERTLDQRHAARTA